MSVMSPMKNLISLLCSFTRLQSGQSLRNSLVMKLFYQNILGYFDEGPNGPMLITRESVDSDRCCVCLSRLKEGNDIRILGCLHEFHRVCINRWLSVYRKTCPVCRFMVEDEEEKSQVEEVFTDEMVIWFSSFHVAGF